MVKINIVLFFCLFFSCIQLTMAQNGGGIWLNDDAYCIGSVISKNKAKEGFGVAGDNGMLLNTTVVGNVEIKDVSSFIIPGHIYCADGVIVSKEKYKEQGKNNAIGIVFWVNSDYDISYPKGAVIAFEQEKKKWGTLSLQISGPKEGEVLNDSILYNVFRDTACYGNTHKIYKYHESGKLDSKDFEGGYYCWTYRGNKVERQWCMASLLYLRRIYAEVNRLNETMKYLNNREHHLFEVSKNDFYYWSSTDNAGVDSESVAHGFLIDFNNGRVLTKDRTRGITHKDKSHWVRPMFLY